MPARNHRIALMGFALEANRFSPPTTRLDFESQVLMLGDEILEDQKRVAPRNFGELSGFIRRMDELMAKRGESWTPVPIAMAAAPPGGPAEKEFFEWLLQEMRQRLAAAQPLDGVYLPEHGAGLAAHDDDADAAVFRVARAAVGKDKPVIATLDLHANVSQAMVDQTDVLISYLTNPHVDNVERGAEAADAMVAMLDGMKPRAYHIKLPIAPAQVTLLTAQGPYADMINLGQARKTDDILNVSVVAGFALADAPQCGISVVVTAKRDKNAAEKLAREIAAKGWAEHGRFIKKLTSLDEAVAMALACGRDKAKPPLIFADVADNPGGGARGNTTWILAAFHKAGVTGCVMGMMIDPPLADEAHRLGKGATFTARFNRDETQEFSKPWSAPARVLEIGDGEVVGRLGIYKGTSVDLGRAALLELDGIRVVVASLRHQAADPAFFERFGIDLKSVRSVVVKSRGHFRAGFDWLFPHERTIEVDVPGLTTPNLATLPFTRIPRPVFPIDPDMTWSVPGA
ncbi:MAG: M81 family metallopeptidase [Alphaproteobacteria bacterium]|nr:M81 family metallopeptidase [Alphaproteobacteria bacterium]